MSAVKTAVEQIKKRWKDAQADGTLCPHDYLALAADSCETLESVCRSIGGDDTAFEGLVKDCEDLVKEYVVPLDLSVVKVPKFIESYILDPQLVALVRPALTYLRPAPHDTH